MIIKTIQYNIYNIINNIINYLLLLLFTCQLFEYDITKNSGQIISSTMHTRFPPNLKNKCIVDLYRDGLETIDQITT